MGQQQGFGNYFIQARLGAGRLTSVYKAFHPVSNEWVVLKVLNEPLLSQPHVRERFLAAAGRARAFQHPNGLPILDFGEIGGVPYLVLPYFEEMVSLADWQSGQPLASLQDVRLWVGQIAVALDAAHAVGLIHRDVKPENVLLANPKLAYLSDFAAG
ncbi:MAG: protein kinase, partial [Anaerolineae bacterium]|nr:protein kinase [Anaerolineae bacterium]